MDFNYINVIPVKNEKIVKTFTNSKNQEYVLTKGSHPRLRGDKVLSLYLRNKDKKQVNVWEKISEKLYSSNGYLLNWRNIKNDEDICLIREKVKTGKGKKNWKITSFEISSNPLSAYFCCKTKEPLQLKQFSNVELLDKQLFESLTPKLKLAIKLFKKSLK